MNGAFPQFLIALLPLAVLVVLLLLGRYPGEESIVRARRAVGRILARAASATLPGISLIERPRSIRGGRLIAHSLAGRGPPFAG